MRGHQPQASSSKNNPYHSHNDDPGRMRGRQPHTSSSKNDDDLRGLHMAATRGHRLYFDPTPSVGTRKDTFHEDQAIVAHDPSPQVLLECLVAAENARAQQLILDFVNSKEALWKRPIIRKTNGFPYYAAATSFHEYSFQPPRCIAHARNGFRSIEECSLIQKSRNRQQIFACPIPNCEIWFIIPTAEVARQQFMIAQQGMSRTASRVVEEEESTGAHIEEVSSDDEPLPTPPASQSKGKGKRKAKAKASSVISISDDDAPPQKRTRHTKQTDRADSPESLPLRFQRERPSRRADGHQSLFGEDTATARYSYNRYLVEQLETGYGSGEFNDTPTAHPTASSIPTQVLEIYDRLSVPPSFLDKHYTRYILETNLGETIIRLNSPVGITSDAELLMQKNNVECCVCVAQFSVTGYNAHITDEGCCGNWPKSKKVDRIDLDDDLLRFPLRSFPRNFLVRDNQPMYKSLQQLSDDAVSVAWSAWHSRVGVPKDVYSLIKTGAVKCGKCTFIRSVNFHLEHLDANNTCTDPGEDQGAVATGND
ncbi:hypothetical protein BDZ89DRAFT_1150069 [Hymenopellis radicata]|nr:hypothetical protein BDZ89DRAFT_1150069 [Hymenopellis radicata]